MRHCAWRAAGEQCRGEHCDFLLLRPLVFFPYSWQERGRETEAFPEAYAIHHWWSSWVRQGEV